MSKDRLISGLDDVSSLCCIACRKCWPGASLAEIHHVRSGAGMAQRSAHPGAASLPSPSSRLLPHWLHAALLTWQQEHGSEEALLEQVAREVTELRKEHHREGRHDPPYRPRCDPVAG